MSYNPQSDMLDFEIGAFGDRFKKAMKKVGKGIAKVTDATIVKPSMMIGGAIGGKKGRELGRKLGKITQKVTHLGIGAGAAGAVAPLAAPLLTSPTALVAAGVAGKKIKKAITKKKKKAAPKKVAPKKAAPKKAAAKTTAKSSPSCNNADAAKIGALLTKTLGGPLDQANKALKLAQLQREATYEHQKLMGDAEFRKKVLSGLATLAADGNTACQRTIRVIMAR